MKKSLSIPTLRRISTIAVLLITAIFFGFLFFLWLSYGNVLSDDVKVSAEKQLLTNFDTSKFDRAVERLEKRRNLDDPANDIRDPFGFLPE